MVRNARIWTADPALPWAGAMVVRDGRIAAVGREDEVEVLAADGSDTLDCEGRLVVPGFIDSHNHLRLGSGDSAVQLAGATTLADIRDRIAVWLDVNLDATWVHGEGFDYAAIPGGRHPRADDLLGATRGLPAMLLDYSVHAAWFNREALALLGADASAPQVAYGTFEVDERGDLTGYLADFATRGLSRAGLAALLPIVPAFGAEAQYHRVRSALRMASRLGITTVVEPQNSLDDLALFTRAEADGDLLSRVVAALFHPVGTTKSEVDEFEQAIARVRTDRFRLGPIKLYIDDIVEPHTAAMLEPYANLPGSRGQSYYSQEEFNDVVAGLDARGLQCLVHATGDRGNRMALNAFEHARQVNGPRDSRHQIVHVECLDRSEVGRFAELGVVPCMQPRHCAPEIVREWRANVGEARWRYAWPMRSLMASGARVAFSSDWNVAEMDPMVGLYTAVTRASLDGSESWVPEESVDIESALHAYTTAGAWANFVEADLGALTVGRLADFAVLSRDVLACEPAELLDTRVVTTVVEGDVVFAE
ncbi:MAG: amidohydrolase family protein [Actinobacteria bacterium]|uniref:Unannotated protein n=1 Tax=freshwater metagenome TaxID=449393 RepID=A0A6J7I8Y4_9ZZZZ|nr:amidohydrolase family protein [Actinomycetota bacterium]